MEKIDSLDKKILNILSQNARIPFKDVAAECGVSRAAIHQRVQHLIENGVITGSGFDVNPKSLGYSTCTYIGLTSNVAACIRMLCRDLLAFPKSLSVTLPQVRTPCSSSFTPKTTSN